MVIVKQTFTVKIKHLEEMVELAQNVAQNALAEASCLSFEIYIQVEKPGNVVLLQNWQGEDEAECYLQSEVAAEFLLAVDGMLAEPVENVCYAVNSLGALTFELITEEQEGMCLGDEVVLH